MREWKDTQQMLDNKAGHLEEGQKKNILSFRLEERHEEKAILKT